MLFRYECGGIFEGWKVEENNFNLNLTREFFKKHKFKSGLKLRNKIGLRQRN